MCADSEKLDHRRLVERDLVGRRHITFRDADVVGHAAVDMDPEHGDALAAIRFAAPAGDARAAREIGNNENLLTDGDRAAGSRFLDFARQFVPDDARIFEERVRAFKNMQIRSANAGATDTHENLALPWARPRPLDDGEFPRFYAKQGSQQPLLLFVKDKKRLSDRWVKLFFTHTNLPNEPE